MKRVVLKRKCHTGYHVRIDKVEFVARVSFTRIDVYSEYMRIHGLRIEALYLPFIGARTPIFISSVTVRNLSLFQKSPGCGHRVDKRIAIPSGGGGESASRCFWQGSHKLNTNWHTRGAPVVFHAFNFHCAGHCV